MLLLSLIFAAVFDSQLQGLVKVDQKVITRRAVVQDLRVWNAFRVSVGIPGVNREFVGVSKYAPLHLLDDGVGLFVRGSPIVLCAAPAEQQAAYGNNSHSGRPPKAKPPSLCSTKGGNATPWRLALLALRCFRYDPQFCMAAHVEIPLE